MYIVHMRMEQSHRSVLPILKKLNALETCFALDTALSLAPVTKSSQLPKPWNIIRTRDTKVKQMPDRNTLGASGFV